MRSIWDRGHLARKVIFSCGQDARGPRFILQE